MALLSDAALLARLVALDTSQPHGNLAAVDLLADYLDRPGIRIARFPALEGPKANLWVEIGPEPTGDRAGLILSGHLDVVPAQEPEWANDPFTLTERDGCLFGRGAADMKGFVALATNLAAECDPKTLDAPLCVLFTYDEEVGTLGARAFTEQWTDRARLPRAAIIGEPTRLKLVRAHKGIVELSIRTTGQSAHSGYPHLGRSAIEPMAAIVTALASLREQLEGERPDAAADFPEVPFVSLNVGTIVGGAAANVIPDSCAIAVTIRPLPGVVTEVLVERVRRSIAAAVRDAPWTLTVVAESPPMLTPDDAPVLRALRAATGQSASDTVSYATDAGWLQTLDLQCAIFGPGDIATAHRPNEFVPVDDLARARAVLMDVLARSQGVR